MTALDTNYRHREVERFASNPNMLIGSSDWTVVARRDHNHISVVVAVFDNGIDDREVWVGWCDGPRRDAERAGGLYEALESFAGGITADLVNGYFDSE